MTQHQIKSERTPKQYIKILREVKGTYIGDNTNYSINANHLADIIESLLQKQNNFTFHTFEKE